MSPEKGGPNDPVAQSIRNQQNRDAMPTEAERKRAHTCDSCDEMKESARMRDPPQYIPGCSGYQAPPPVTLCDECYESKKQTKEDAINRHFEEGDDFVVEYACGMLRSVDLGVERMKAGDDNDPYAPHRGWSPDVPLQHDRCGAVIETVWEPDDLEGEEDD